MNIVKFLFRCVIATASFLMEILAGSIASLPNSAQDDLKRHREWQEGRDRLKMESFDSVSQKISKGEL